MLTLFPPLLLVPTVLPSVAREAPHLSTSYVQNVPYVCKGACGRQQLSSHPVLMPPLPFLSFPSSTNSVAATCHPSYFPEEPHVLPSRGLCPGCSLYLKSSSLGLHLASGPYWKLTWVGLPPATLPRVVSLPTVAVSSLDFSVWYLYMLHTAHMCWFIISLLPRMEARKAWLVDAQHCVSNASLAQVPSI